MKIIQFGSSGNMIAVGEDEVTAVWFNIADNVKPFLDKFKVGDEVEIRSEKINGTETLKFIGKAGFAPKKPAFTPRATGGYTAKPAYQPKANVVTASAPTTASKFGRTPEENDSIKRQAIGHMTSRTLIALQGHVNTDNILIIMETVYKKYQELVG